MVSTFSGNEIKSEIKFDQLAEKGQHKKLIVDLEFSKWKFAKLVSQKGFNHKEHK